MPVRVLHLIGGGEIGGAEHHVLNLLQYAAQEEVIPVLGCLVKNSPFAALTHSLGIQTTVFPMRFALDILPVAQIASYCRKNQIQLIHCHGSRANLVGRLTSKIASLPCISTLHSLPEWDYPSVWKGNAARYINNFTLSWSSGFIAISANFRDYLSLRLRQRGLNLPINIIPNGLVPYDFSQSEQMRFNFRKRWNIPLSCKLVGTIGRLHPVKGHLCLTESMKILMKDHPNLHVVIIGEGPSRQELEDLLRSAKIPHTLTGYLPDAWKTLPSMDLFVLPSLSEGMGLVLMEAAQAEVPIVASCVGGVPELFQDNSEALLACPGDPIDLARCCDRLLSDPDLVNRLTAKARERARGFTVEKMAKDTAAFYYSILNQ
ncbi:MAG: putative teichuronic acid biosynthesis glycosyltransferase TuaC [Candidatus Dichloromethanomonas elyunquensis]|nr:MAG: putative teichuronic acid biosynthesis glycosyltransferase TuaC [Candidatus Dichloromethanomonas elyunquensis]